MELKSSIRYPAYKPSGIPWLGDIPNHWKARRLKFVSNIVVSNVDKNVDEDEIPVKLCNYVDVYKNDFISDVIDYSNGTAQKREIRKFSIQKSDVLITKDSESWFDIAKPAYVSKTFDGLVCGYHLAIVRPLPGVMFGSFLFRLLQSKPINHQYIINTFGITRYGLGKGSINDGWVLVPPPPEQQAIADFLDRETSQIDTLIAKYTRLSDLLAEKRTALITHTVTHGLPSPSGEGRVRGSGGLPWLGEIPSNWKVMFLKNGYDALLGKMIQPEQKSSEDTLVPYLRTANVYWEGIDISDIKEMWFSPYEKQQYRLKPGDLIVCEGGDVGRSAIWLGALNECYIQNAVHRIRPKKGQINKFLYYWLYFLKHLGYIDLLCSKATISHLTGEKLAVLPIVSPPLPEQKAIADYLDQQTLKIDQARQKIQTLIEKLKERRSALITAAVTGKLSVTPEHN